MTPVALGGFSLQALAQNPLLSHLLQDCDDRVLVIVQLNGGNDGLNTVIPLDQYSNLSKVRSNVLLPDNKVLRLGNTDTGLHPSLDDFENLFDDEQMAIVHSVGYPEPNLSHFRATDIWTSGSPSDEVWTTGWLGRYLETVFPNYPDGYPNAAKPHPAAITVGSALSQTCQGPVANMSMAIPNLNSFLDLSSGFGGTPPNNRYGYELSYLRELMTKTNQYFDVIEAAADSGSNAVNYPGTKLGKQLEIVANLISGGLKTSIYVVNLGGFDTHAAQVITSDKTTGTHANLLNTLSEAVAAFQQDLRSQKLDDRVMGMTFSEFGRRIRSNGSNGTDHGAAAPLFVFGSHANPTMIGTHPTISANVGNKDNVPMQYDFRSIYGSLLEDWFCVPADTIKTLLFEDYQHVPVIRQSVTSQEQGPQAQLFDNYPNPFHTSTTIRFQLDGASQATLQVFDGIGRVIHTLTERTFSAGSYSFDFDGSNLPAGVYYYRIQTPTQQQIKPMLKQ